jgi:PucR C-terminal helix-turn-helix domain
VAKSVQQAVDRLSAALGLSVLVEDVQQRPLWWSTVGPVDQVRTRTILDRHVDRAAAEVVRRFRLREAISPVRTPAMPERGMWARWAVPVRNGNVPLGLLWVLDPDGIVSEADLARMSEVAELAAAELAKVGESTEQEAHARNALLARLLNGPDSEAAEELARREHLPTETMIVVEHPSRAGGWPLPGDLSIHVQRGLRRDASSGAGLPLVQLAEATRRARATRRAIAAGARVELATYNNLGAWLLVVNAAAEVTPAQVHPAAALLAGHPRADLLQTARTVLDRGGDIAAAAQLLHIHRTTLYYRLDKIAELTGVDLRNGSSRTDLQVALWLAAYRSAPE